MYADMTVVTRQSNKITSNEVKTTKCYESHCSENE